jgi:hypothetical protein
VLRFGLQQLGAGLQQYLGSGQLLAALTRQVVDAIIALCQLLWLMYHHLWQAEERGLSLGLAMHVRQTGRVQPKSGG